jgi:alpha-2-macroglobulin
VANSGPNWFGTGETQIRTAQDLSIFSGLPPLVRTGDWYGASFTLRNGTDKPMKVTASVKVTPQVATGEPLTVTIPAGGAVPVTWNLTAPVSAGTLRWEVEAKGAGGKAVDRVSATQQVDPAVPVEVWAATLTRVGQNTSIPLMAPEGALPGFGFVDVKLSDTLAPPLAGVRDYMSRYPYSCFEQQTSKLVVAGDTAGWDALVAKIPAYLDKDGLLRYWPIQTMDGDEALTAYVLSIASEAGLAIPDENKNKMLAAMKSVVDGRLRRDRAWARNDKALRVSALAALARNGAATPAMLGSIGTAPVDMPTSMLTEWMTAIDRTAGANKSLRTAAETVLRQRLVYEGSRLDLVDGKDAPWWMMVSTDEMAIRALLSVLGRPGWGDEEAKMMVGVALRQSRGHWDTTPANAWGVVAARRFASLYPATAITGMTSVALGSEVKSVVWPLSDRSAGSLLGLSLPMAKTSLVMNQASGPGPWAAVSLSAAVPLKAPLFAGYRVTKEFIPLQQEKKGQFTRGDVMKVRITVEAGAERNWVVVNDPVPPGATILGNIGGQSQIMAGQASGGEGVYPSYIERGLDAWRGYFEWVPAGKFVTEYAVRLNGVGQFTLPPTRGIGQRRVGGCRWQ